jgi:hypothetical protein
MLGPWIVLIFSIALLISLVLYTAGVFHRR